MQESQKTEITLNMTDNQERQKSFYHSFYVHEGFIPVVSLLNDLMKILVGFGIFNRVIFKKEFKPITFRELNYHHQKIRRPPAHDIRKYWTALSTLLGLVNSVDSDLFHRRSNQQPQKRNSTLSH